MGVDGILEPHGTGFGRGGLSGGLGGLERACHQQRFSTALDCLPQHRPQLGYVARPRPALQLRHRLNREMYVSAPELRGGFGKQLDRKRLHVVRPFSQWLHVKINRGEHGVEISPQTSGCQEDARFPSAEANHLGPCTAWIAPARCPQHLE